MKSANCINNKKWYYTAPLEAGCYANEPIYVFVLFHMRHRFFYSFMTEIKMVIRRKKKQISGRIVRVYISLFLCGRCAIYHTRAFSCAKQNVYFKTFERVLNDANKRTVCMCVCMCVRQPAISIKQFYWINKTEEKYHKNMNGWTTLISRSLYFSLLTIYYLYGIFGLFIYFECLFSFDS